MTKTSLNRAAEHRSRCVLWLSSQCHGFDCQCATLPVDAQAAEPHAPAPRTPGRSPQKIENEDQAW